MKSRWEALKCVGGLEKISLKKEHISRRKKTGFSIDGITVGHHLSLLFEVFPFYYSHSL